MNIRNFLFENLYDEEMYSIHDLFVLLAKLTGKDVGETDFYGFNIVEIEKILSDEYEEKKSFKRRRNEEFWS